MALSLVFLPQFHKADGQPVDLMEQNTSLNKPQKSEHRYTESDSFGKNEAFRNRDPDKLCFTMLFISPQKRVFLETFQVTVSSKRKKT